MILDAIIRLLIRLKLRRRRRSDLMIDPVDLLQAMRRDKK
jgi:hypothetical protein